MKEFIALEDGTVFEGKGLGVAGEVGFPLIIRPGHTLGGTGASVTYSICPDPGGPDKQGGVATLLCPLSFS
ncbi:MAG TPA: hypothetical protein DCZ04_04380 [Syntrophorhabdus aromaticivorans]|nr:hypothetical protein [Syntrophorhabdus aromaticivorans]